MTSQQKRVELLAPAGDWPSLLTALEAGADSVYFGIKGINMRHFAGNFDLLELPKVMAEIHQRKARGYLTLNTLIMQDDMRKVDAIIEKAAEAHVDAVIACDLGVIEKARQKGLPVHLSTQASVANSDAVAAFARLGVSRIVLARECSLDDIIRIVGSLRAAQIPCEIETFIHGAMCVSISGRCFLSYLAHGTSANKGQCVQSCRREYEIRDVEEDSSFILGRDYVLSPKDVCTIEFIDRLIAAGIDSFKIEGRMRPAEYAGTVTSCYRRAIDAYYQGSLTEELKQELLTELTTVYNRGFSPGFYFGPPKEWESRQLDHTYQKKYVGYVTRIFKKIGVAEILIQNESVKIGDTLLFIGKSSPVGRSCVEEMRTDAGSVICASRGDVVALKAPESVRPKQKVFLWDQKGEGGS